MAPASASASLLELLVAEVSGLKLFEDEELDCDRLQGVYPGSGHAFWRRPIVVTAAVAATQE